MPRFGQSRNSPRQPRFLSSDQSRNSTTAKFIYLDYVSVQHEEPMLVRPSNPKLSPLPRIARKGAPRSHSKLCEWLIREKLTCWTQLNLDKNALSYSRR